MGDNQFTIIDGGSIITPRGFKAAGLHCGLKKTDRNDLGIILCDVPAVAAAVYTTNLVQAAPLKITRESLQDGKLRAIVVNSGNANACTGTQGEEDAYTMRSSAAARIGIDAQDVAVASTGVIGELLKMDRVTTGIVNLPAQLRGDSEGAEAFSQAILTTDLVKKEACVTVQVGEQQVTIAGAAKGSGMIHPNMATMLGFMTTDAVIRHDALQLLLRQTTNLTFNMITVDGDTSTNDMLVAMASGLADNEELSPEHPDWEAFAAGFHYVCQQLAMAIARDGEGASRLIEVRVHGAECD
ncbi:bifunctional glutamate N-acetyltransferase/amino-acid acetyltransferase ArgJ, partial [Peribacillus sp. NPDC056705]|uniref:bifunctional glutamate N-acetyltransferase/amino-acid acetyltransferase ArgJ n=1 Tax=Peribacillus sp. NPDC056705 TaxID=3345918 RepID=UPI00374A82ED